MHVRVRVCSCVDVDALACVPTTSVRPLCIHVIFQKKSFKKCVILIRCIRPTRCKQHQISDQQLERGGFHR